MATTKSSIVQVKVQRDCPRGSRVKTSKKEHRHGEAVCRSSGMALAFPATTPPGASAEGVDQGQLD
jgi:hypothetical protein